MDSPDKESIAHDSWDRNYSVIDLADFGEFLCTAYATYCATGPHRLITQALHLVAPSAGRTIETGFTTLYAALEMLTLWYRQQKSLELIISDDSEWEIFCRDVRKFVSDHPLSVGATSERKQRRAYLRAKVGELRRIPFRATFEAMCVEYAIQLDDLWPMFGPSSDLPLTEIRNRLVHGNAFSGSQYGPLVGAEDHMRWTVERVMLLLAWPIDRSNVRPQFLAKSLTSMIELANDRASIRDGVATEP